MRLFLKIAGVVALLIVCLGKDADAQRRSKKMRIPFYSKSGSILVNGGIQLFTKQRTTTLPVYINPEYVVTNDIAVGLKFMHYEYKHYLQNAEELSYFTEWTEETGEVRYNHMMFGITGTYFFNNLLKNKANINLSSKYIVYAQGLVGYNIVTAASSGAEATADNESSTIRLSADVGLRYMYSKNLSFYGAYTLNEYGHATVGVSLVIPR